MNNGTINPSDFKILAVDDSAFFLKLLGKILGKKGYHVEPLSEGESAVPVAKVVKPDLILLDIVMPGIDGYQICQNLKKDPQTQDIPVIFISGQGEEQDKVKTFGVGGVDCMTKPFFPGEVLARVETHLTISALRKRLQTENLDLEQRVNERTFELIKLNRAFERFVPQEFLEILDKKSVLEVQLGDHLQLDMSIMFTDIRSFTSLSEQMSPQENFDFINSYLDKVCPTVMNHGGIIDKYIGDAILALFKNHPENSLIAAISIGQELSDYNVYRVGKGFSPVRNGTGIHTGPMMLGIIGEENRLQNTVISDSVNLASRVQDLTKVFGAKILLTSDTLIELKRLNKVQLQICWSR